MRTPNWLDDPVHRAAVSVAASTVVLTLAMVGILAFVDGGNTGVGGRLPAYVFAAALAFVVTLFVLDDPAADGVQIIVAVAGISLGVFGLVALAGEGVVYAVEHPGEVFVPELLAYIAAAGLICTGIGVWGLRHWREFTAGPAVEEDPE